MDWCLCEFSDERYLRKFLDLIIQNVAICVSNEQKDQLEVITQIYSCLCKHGVFSRRDCFDPVTKELSLKHYRFKENGDKLKKLFNKTIINEIWNTINKSLEKCQNKEAIEIINNMWKLFLKVLEIWKEEMKLLRSVDILSLEEIRNLLRLIDKINIFMTFFSKGVRSLPNYMHHKRGILIFLLQDGGVGGNTMNTREYLYKILKSVCNVSFIFFKLWKLETDYF